jgi:ElaB/YqjD/DUF883 family membrane-anchored ribosome-binding protein
MSASDSSSTSTDATTEPGADARQRLEQHYRELEQTYDDTRARLEDFNEQAVDFIRENPAICIVGALAAGYVVGRLASRRWLR